MTMLGFGAGTGSKYEVITTILTEPASYALTTPQVVQAELDIAINPGDAVMLRYIAEASDAVHKYCNRTFPVHALQDEIRPPREGDIPTAVSGIDFLQLSSWPVITSAPPTALSVVERYETTLTLGTDFELDARKGTLTRLDAWRPRRWHERVTVQYSAGFAIIPSAISGAVIRMCCQRYFARGRDPMLRAETVQGVGSLQYWVNSSATGGVNGNMSPDVESMLEPYRSRFIG